MRAGRSQPDSRTSVRAAAPCQIRRSVPDTGRARPSSTVDARQRRLIINQTVASSLCGASYKMLKNAPAAEPKFLISFSPMKARMIANRTGYANRISSNKRQQHRTNMHRKNGSNSPSWLQSSTLLVGTLSLCFIAARLFVVAAGNVNTAYAILQAQGTASVAVGSLIPAVGLLIFPVASLSFYNHQRGNHDQTTKSVLLMIAIVGLILTLFAAPAILLGTVIVSSFIYAILIGRINKSKKRVLKVGTFPDPNQVVVVYFGFMLLLLFLVPYPWLPSQNITVKNGVHITGYILSQNADISILTTSPVKVIQVPASKIISESICQPPDGWRSESVFELAGFAFNEETAASYPICWSS
jgi:hypothetical protein